MPHYFIEILFRLHTEEEGATATEYLILLVLVACFIIAVVKVYGETVEFKFANGNNAVARSVTF